MGVFILFIQNIIVFLFLTPLIIIGLFQIASTLSIFKKYNKLIVLLEIVYLMGVFLFLRSQGINAFIFLLAISPFYFFQKTVKSKITFLFFILFLFIGFFKFIPNDFFMVRHAVYDTVLTKELYIPLIEEQLNLNDNNLSKIYSIKPRYKGFYEIILFYDGINDEEYYKQLKENPKNRLINQNDFKNKFLIEYFSDGELIKSEFSFGEKYEIHPNNKWNTIFTLSDFTFPLLFKYTKDIKIKITLLENNLNFPSDLKILIRHKSLKE